MTANTNKKLATSTSTEALDNIKQDVYTLKADVIELGRTVKSEGLQKIEQAASDIHDKIDNLKKEGSLEVDKVQRYISQNPNQSVGIAFAAGIALTLLLNRR